MDMHIFIESYKVHGTNLVPPHFAREHEKLTFFFVFLYFYFVLGESERKNTFFLKNGDPDVKIWPSFEKSHFAHWEEFHVKNKNEF